LFNESGVAEMEVKRGDNSVRLRRCATATEVMVPVAAAPPVSAVAATPVASAVSIAPKPAPPEDVNELVKSPIVGTYYDAPGPGSPPFVGVGDEVKPGQVLCIIESMKLMNEIESEIAGIVAAKLVENGRPVEYGEALFAIHPR